ncbi:MAG TPA: hypothetical protein VIG32_07825, partial [Candidatus Baltobacteraceae bacterium]
LRNHRKHDDRRQQPKQQQRQMPHHHHSNINKQTPQKIHASTSSCFDKLMLRQAQHDNGNNNGPALSS